MNIFYNPAFKLIELLFIFSFASNHSRLMFNYMRSYAQCGWSVQNNQRHVAFSSCYRIILPTFAVISIYSPLSGSNKVFIYSFFVFFYQ